MNFVGLIYAQGNAIGFPEDRQDASAYCICQANTTSSNKLAFINHLACVKDYHKHFVCHILLRSDQ
jgi:hypothetical protein